MSKCTRDFPDVWISHATVGMIKDHEGREAHCVPASRKQWKDQIKATIWLQKWSILKQNVIWCHLFRAVPSLNCEGRACLWLTGPEVIECPIAALWASMTCDLLLASWPEFPPFVGGRWANPPEHISPFWATFRPDPAQLMNYLTRLHINETLAIKIMW